MSMREDQSWYVWDFPILDELIDHEQPELIVFGTQPDLGNLCNLRKTENVAFNSSLTGFWVTVTRNQMLRWRFTLFLMFLLFVTRT